jgi:hypothetical protein
MIIKQIVIPRNTSNAGNRWLVFIAVVLRKPNILLSRSAPAPSWEIIGLTNLRILNDEKNGFMAADRFLPGSRYQPFPAPHRLLQADPYFFAGTCDD